MTVAIEFVDVVKHYQRKGTSTAAIDGLSFEVQAGEFLGYAGPNGAGKSTSIKAMTGLLAVTGGTVRVRGLDPLRKRKILTRHVGVVFGQRSQMIWELPASGFFEMIRLLYGVSTADWTRRLAHLTEVLDLGSFVDQPVRSLSLGQRMRCELATALLPRPDVLFLDEPTIGLDVEAKAAIRDVLRELNEEEGTTILLTTHDLSDIETLCSRLMVIDHGRLAYDGTIEQLFTTHAPEMTVEFRVPSEAPLDLDPSWTVTHQHGMLRVTFHRERHAAAEIIRSVLDQSEVSDLRILEPDIEGVIRTIYAATRC